MINVLLALGAVPPFDQIAAEDIAPALTQLITAARADLAAVKAIRPVTWENSIEPVTAVLEKVNRAWGVVEHLNAVADTPALRDAYNAMLPAVSDFFSAVSHDAELFRLYQTVAAGAAEAGLSPARQRALAVEIQDFELSGVSLAPAKKARFVRLNAKLAQLASRFSQNVLDATAAFQLSVTDKAQLAGVPADITALFRENAERAGKAGYLLDLRMPSYLALLKFAENRDLRQKVHYAYSTRASDLGPAKWNNGNLINQILRKKNGKAQLLGYPTAAHVSLVSKMAAKPETALALIDEIITHARPGAERDWLELQDFARRHLSLPSLRPWDLAFATEKLRERQYSFSAEEVKAYFPLSKVLAGLIKLIGILYGVSLKIASRPVWHDSVQYFTLSREKQEIGGIYLDLFARSGKKGGAWMDGYCGKWELTKQLPAAFIVANFTPAASGAAVYLSHDEILTLFHEMGHALHHVLTGEPDLNVAGINGVEWDAVELPSQFMENFAWEYDVLVSMAEHRDSGKVLPRVLYDKMLSARNFQAGSLLLRQMEFALFDLTIFSSRQKPVPWQDILQEVRTKTALMPTAPYNRFAQSFEHIFAGGYGAGYYSYIWAEVLAADVYAAFKENPDRRAMGQLFWREILSRGGSRPALQSFMAFRGRKPSTAALFTQLGLNVPPLSGK